MTDTCCAVVNQFCDYPANTDDDTQVVRAECFRCGQNVCIKCSSRRMYGKYGRKRLCDNCQEDIDGNDRAIMRKAYRMAGYTYEYFKVEYERIVNERREYDCSKG